MENNEKQNMQDKVAEAKQTAQEASKFVANVASGNILGAAKSALNLMKNKKLRRKLILKACMPIIVTVLCATCILGVFNAVKETMVGLISKVGTTIGGFWQWMTDDYWIKIDEKIEFETADGQKESYTIVEKYIKELEELGVSLESLRILGEADYSKEDILEDEQNKELVEKYIAEFVRADIITQQPHKRNGTELIDSLNPNHIDGAVYFERTKKEAVISDDDLVNEKNVGQELEVEDKEYKQMTYISYDKFIDKLGIAVSEANEMIENGTFTKVDKRVALNLRYNYTIDEDTGNVIMIGIRTTTKKNYEITEGQWFAGISKWWQENAFSEEEYEIQLVSTDYKQYISKYTMPYEFLINLCEITQNPEFVYHVALLARNTKIVLGVQDNITVERETLETEIDSYDYKNYDDNSVSGASASNKKTKKERNTTTVATYTPILNIQYADTWSFYEDKEYTKTSERSVSQSEITTEDIRGETLANHVDAVYEYYATGAIIDGEPEYIKTEVSPEYWYEDGMESEKRYATEFVTKTTEYNEASGGQSVEKSKQFLGLLRNSTGECPYECYEKSDSGILWPNAVLCATTAEFDRYGKDVKYRIPNTTKKEAPMDNLLSGLDLLYAMLQSNSSGYTDEKLLGENENYYNKQEEYIADEDYESAYIVKMQGLAEHMKYLMTFPDESSYTIKDIILEALFGSEDEIIDDADNYTPEYTWNGTTSELIELLGEYANQDMKESGILASVTVAQALLESGWGKSTLSSKYNNYFGIKAGSSWKGHTVTMSTKEQDTSGNVTTIKAKFRVYESLYGSIQDHSKILSASRYSGVIGEKNYRKAITIIKNGGYATDVKYVDKVCKIIEEYGLTRFDT